MPRLRAHLFSGAASLIADLFGRFAYLVSGLVGLLPSLLRGAASFFPGEIAVVIPCAPGGEYCGGHEYRKWSLRLHSERNSSSLFRLYDACFGFVCGKSRFSPSRLVFPQGAKMNSGGQPTKMARGWESKDIESQITGANVGADHDDPHYRSVAERELINKRAALMLDRGRVSRELNTARNERFRLQLRAELEYINRQLAALEPQA